ncbi:MAG: hypothetical protein QOF51_2629 [Chloroflexota bacterium]|jgi:hypothetical protein|nr:hypothetical protein [Chloroflexota bacterium]
MDRITNAFTIPFVVIPGAAVVAILIGVLLHRFDGLYISPNLRVAPIVALVLVLLVMGAGFIADRMAGPSTPQPAASGRQQPPRRRRR